MRGYQENTILPSNKQVPKWYDSEKWKLKTGKAGLFLDVNLRTLKNWIERFPEFFSAAARGENVMQRSLNETDLIVLNTIKTLRSQGIQEWDVIGERLKAGYRVSDIPDTAIFVDMGATPVQAVQRAIVTRQELDIALEKINEQADLIDELEAQLKQTQAEATTVERELQSNLHEQQLKYEIEIARLKMQLEMWESGQVKPRKPGSSK